MTEFALGILLSKFSFSMNLKVASVDFTMADEHLAQHLTDCFGGFLTYRYVKNEQSLRWRLGSKKDLQTLQKAILRFNKKLPLKLAAHWVAFRLNGGKIKVHPKDGNFSYRSITNKSLPVTEEVVT